MTYVFENARDEARTRMEALAVLYDRGTIQVLQALGIVAGWRCLEIGGGGPWIPCWLSDTAGPAGSVLITDIEPRFLEGIDRANVEVRRHDITADPLPEGAFDLVHSRLVLQHLSAQDRALRRMANALRPGGWLVIEDFGSERLPSDPAFPAPAALARVREVQSEAMRAGGVRLVSQQRLRQLLQERGLQAIGSEGRLIPWVGGEAGGRLLRANLQQMSSRLFARGIEQDELDQALAACDDPTLVLLSPLMWAVWGQRPNED